MFAVDAGSTQGVAQVMEQFGLHEQGVKAGGYDLLPETQAHESQAHRLHHRSAALSAGLLPRHATLPLQHLRRGHGARRDEHGPHLHNTRHCGPLPRDRVALRGGLRRSRRSCRRPRRAGEELERDHHRAGDAGGRDAGARALRPAAGRPRSCAGGERLPSPRGAGNLLSGGEPGLPLGAEHPLARLSFCAPTWSSRLLCACCSSAAR